MTTSALIAIVAAIVVIALAIAALIYIRRQRSRKLQSHFGTEYQDAIRTYGSPSKAEDALLARQERREKLTIRPLSAEDRTRFADAWHGVQSRFVDDP